MENSIFRLHDMREKNIVISVFCLHVMRKRNVEISISSSLTFSVSEKNSVLLQDVFERNMETSKFLRDLP